MPQGKAHDRSGYSPKTVRNHITSIFDKVQVADRAEAILRARAAGWDSEGNGEK